MSTSDAVRTPEQVARERGLTKVYDALEEIEIVTERVRRYRDEVAKLSGCDDLVAVMGTAADRLSAARRELLQGAVFNAGQSRLF
jgi:hypothetical protein